MADKQRLTFLQHEGGHRTLCALVLGVGLQELVKAYAAHGRHAALVPISHIYWGKHKAVDEPLPKCQQKTKVKGQRDKRDCSNLL